MEKRSGARATKEKENATTKKPRMLRKAPMATKEQQQDEGEKHRTLSVILDLDTCRYKSLYRMLGITHLVVRICLNFVFLAPSSS
jgi:hypothetical protein